MIRGYAKLHRKLIDWEWYNDIPVRLTFMHLLITVNYKPSRYHGYEIGIGCRVIGKTKLSSEIGISEQQLRTALKKLKSTHDINIKATNKFSIITLINWELYQDRELIATNKQQTNNIQSTNEQHSNNIPSTPSKEGKKKRSKEMKNKTISTFVLPDSINKKKWDSLMEIRIAKKAVQSDEALTTIVNKLLKMGSDADEALDNAIESSWKTVYPLNKQQRQHVQQGESVAEQAQRIRKERQEGAQA